MQKSDSKRLALFLAVCFAVSLVCDAPTIWVSTAFPAFENFMDDHGAVALYGFPIVLCGVAGIAMKIWTRDSVLRNFLASIFCFLAPVATGTAILVTWCFGLNKCL